MGDRGWKLEVGKSKKTGSRRRRKVRGQKVRGRKVRGQREVGGLKSEVRGRKSEVLRRFVGNKSFPLNSRCINY